jgi:hypothetical protein
VVNAWLDKSERLVEFTGLCQQVGIATHVTVSPNYYPPEGDSPPLDWALVLFDGTDIGQVSDGTVRTAEILWALLTLGSSGLLLLEEPETGIHPGLIRKLLAVIDSYTIDHQVLVSTHSLQVVNWARPEEIRLVERTQNVTRARALSQAQLKHLGAYLDDEGSLGDFVYGGGAED